MFCTTSRFVRAHREFCIPFAMVTVFDPLKIRIIYVNSLTPKTLLFTREKFSVFYTELKFVQFWLVFAQIWFPWQLPQPP